MESKDRLTRREILSRAGWVLPAVLTVSLSTKALAQYQGPPDPGPDGVAR
jgi:hypothetical protein